MNILQYVNLFQTFSSLKRSNKRNFIFSWKDKFLKLNDASSNTDFDRHYTYHPAWAIRKIKEHKISEHVDISSILSFSANLSAFIPVRFYDYRPANLVLDNLITGSEDLTLLSFETNSISSLSCMHTIEHIGLGRYGDPIDYDGDLKAISELSRVLAPGGLLLIVVPVGKENKIVFNAHRIYESFSFINYFTSEGLVLKEFTLIPDSSDDGHLVMNPSNELLSRQSYACGCFLFTK
jgi:SAM-dependent methyltransferase